MNETVYRTGTGNDTSSTAWGGGYYVDVGAPRAGVPPGAASDRPYEFHDWDNFPAKEGRDENMRGLYRIIVVNPKTEEIGDPVMVIAKDEGAAMIKAALKGAIKGKVEDYDILVDRLGDVRAKKETQKVKVIKEEEE